MIDPIFVSIGGGKGGVGKSTVAAHLGAMLSKKGFSVGFIDADLGGANLHSFVGVKRPSLGLQDFLSGRGKSLEQVACKTAIPKKTRMAF
jgi:flagellar biosynthesis protein FlhG